MKTQREEKLEKQLAACKEALSSSRKALHRERQKIRDLIGSRSRHKSKNALLRGKLKEAEAIKKTVGRRHFGTVYRQAQIYGFYSSPVCRSVCKLSVRLTHHRSNSGDIKKTF